MKTTSNLERLIADKFKTGNSTPVDRITITRAEYEATDQKLTEQSDSFISGQEFLDAMNDMSNHTDEIDKALNIEALEQ